MRQKEKLFLSFLDQYSKQIYRVCWGFTSSPNDVNELFQECIIRIWKGLDGFKGKSSASTWIYRISVNTCIYWQKSKRSIQLYSDIEDVSILPVVPSIEDYIIKGENIARLRKAIQQLSKIDRTIILLNMEECSYKDIAEITGLSVTNIGAKTNRIKMKLNKLFNKN